MQMAKTSALGRHAQKGTTVYIRAHRSHYRRRDGQLCLLGDIILAEPAPSLSCRPTGHSADHWADPARGLPAGGISGGTRFCGRCGAPETDAGNLVRLLLLHEKGGREWKN